jgi:proline iminopeptidase
VAKWHVVFGGSWGSTLALAYAQAYPLHVRAMVLRGIFLFSKAELELSRSSSGPAAQLFPEEFERYRDHLSVEERSGELEVELENWWKRMQSEDRSVSMQAAQAWNRWELTLGSLVPESEETKYQRLDDQNWCLTHAKLELHYARHAGFLRDKQLVEASEIRKLREAGIDGEF